MKRDLKDVERDIVAAKETLKRLAHEYVDCMDLKVGDIIDCYGELRIVTKIYPYSFNPSTPRIFAALPKKDGRPSKNVTEIHTYRKVDE